MHLILIPVLYRRSLRFTNVELNVFAPAADCVTPPEVIASLPRLFRADIRGYPVWSALSRLDLVVFVSLFIIGGLGMHPNANEKGAARLLGRCRNREPPVRRSAERDIHIL